MQKTQRKTMQIRQEYDICRRREADTLFGGRLSTYRYYDMDQVIAAALTLTAQERG